MKLECIGYNVWQGSGRGPLRPIVVESTTRMGAHSAFVALLSKQYAQRPKKTA